MTKTYSQKQMDSAKKREHKKGYDLGFAQGNLGVEAVESANQVQEWKKWEQFDFDWTVILLVVACVGAILMMIF